MYYIRYLEGIAFLFWCVSSAVGEDICRKYLRDLASSQSLFVQCSTLHAVPVSLCNGCEEPYNAMQAWYIKLNTEKNCTTDYFDKDRINIVSTTQSILAGLWSKAYCDDCFTSNNSYVFDLKKTDLYDCLSQHKGSECSSCLADYLTLNNFYVSLDKNNDGKICYDLQDAMNRTRLNWSKKLKCCHRDSDMMIFLIVCSIVATLPILFYGTTFALTKRQERNHDLLVEDPQNSLPRRVNPHSSVADLPSTSSAATCPRVPSKNILNDVELTSSDDSEMEATPKASKKYNKNE